MVQCEMGHKPWIHYAIRRSQLIVNRLFIKYFLSNIQKLKVTYILWVA